VALTKGERGGVLSFWLVLKKKFKAKGRRKLEKLREVQVLATAHVCCCPAKPDALVSQVELQVLDCNC
jgi:hypothetical protein